MYSFKSRIRYSEVDQNTFLTLDKLIDYFQDCCIFHSETAGLGVEKLEAQKYCWMLTGWQIQIKEMPKLSQEVTVSTWPYNFKSCNGWRNFTLENEAGEKIACADSQWVFIDMNSGRPTTIPEKQLEGYLPLGEAMEMDLGGKKIPIPTEAEEKDSFIVRADHIDTNHHVNNSQYVKMALAQLPTDIKITKMRAEYKRQAKLGDTIIPKVKTEESKWTVALCNEAGKPYSLVEITGTRQ